MTHELIAILKSFKASDGLGLKSVLITVVALNGSSYRKPGVRMLLDTHGKMTGAVSGGCVEKEIQRQAQTVFADDTPVMMTYDGRYRIGCEGLLYILIEPFQPNLHTIHALEELIANRAHIELHSYYQKEKGSLGGMGTELVLSENQKFGFSNSALNHRLNKYTQVLPPCFRLFIVGIEHDAQHLCAQAALLGWEIVVLKSLDQMHDPAAFPANVCVIGQEATAISQLNLDSYSAFVLMSHNFAKDLNYLLQLSYNSVPLYIGVLGSKKRMEQLFTDLLERNELVSEEFLDSIHGPAGLDIKAITPQEIAISIIGQVIQYQRAQTLVNTNNHSFITNE